LSWDGEGPAERAWAVHRPPHGELDVSAAEAFARLVGADLARPVAVGAS
jgi:hypothetical protein